MLGRDCIRTSGVDDARSDDRTGHAEHDRNCGWQTDGDSFKPAKGNRNARRKRFTQMADTAHSKPRNQQGSKVNAKNVNAKNDSDQALNSQPLPIDLAGGMRY